MKAKTQKQSVTSLENRAGWLFVLPTMLILAVFVYIPLFISMAFSVLKFDMLFQNMDFVQLENYKKLL